MEQIESAPCGFISTSREGEMVRANRTLHRMLGAEDRSLEGRMLDEILSPGARLLLQTHLLSALYAKGTLGEVYLSLLHADGHAVPVLVNARRSETRPEYDWVLVGIQRRSQFEDELLQAKRAAEEADRAKSRFLSMLSHDLRTPLTGITMASELLLRGVQGPLTPDQERDLQRIADASRHVSGLVRDLLAYARLDARLDSTEVLAAPVDEEIRRAVAMVHHLGRDAGVEVEARYPPAPALALTQPARLRQVLLNLLTNAIKFTPEGGRVVTTVACTDDHVRISVQDTGRGIAESELDLVFEPFYQSAADPLVAREGFGLGLAISQRILQAQGGALSVASRLGEGACFTITLPAASL